MLKNFSKIIGKNSYLVIGVDLIKNKKTLENAYNDKLGVTAKFNKNILNVVNNICNSKFQTNNFKHKAFYNLKKNRIEMHLISKKNFTLKINKKNIKVTKDDTIHTENSHKYSKNNFVKLVNKSGFKVLKYFTDKKNYFGVFLLKVK